MSVSDRGLICRKAKCFLFFRLAILGTIDIPPVCEMQSCHGLDTKGLIAFIFRSPLLCAFVRSAGKGRNGLSSAGVAKLVDAPDLGSGAARRGGSSPSTRTKNFLYQVPTRCCASILALCRKGDDSLFSVSHSACIRCATTKPIAKRAKLQIGWGRRV